jgi:predicted ATP-grasp superfamily ATP-dependent carboligase
LRILVYEFVTGGGLVREPLPLSLAREADLMARALVEDLREIPDVEVLVSRDPRFTPIPGVATLVAPAGRDPLAHYSGGLGAADAVWPTAPETGGVLERLAREAVAQGKILLGSDPAAVRIATSKQATVAALRGAGVPAILTVSRPDRLPALPGRWVVKPDDGAGCDGALVVADWRAARERLAAEPPGLVAQPWIEGASLSLSLLCVGGRASLLSCNRQHVRVVGGGLVLERITVNAVADGDGRLAALADRIAAAIPGLRGYVGVDLVWGQDGPVVLEINPRLTTSYCGLREALGVNAAAMVVELLRIARRAGGRRGAGGRRVEIVLAESAPETSRAS